jgi:hypothetical protein
VGSEAGGGGGNTAINWYGGPVQWEGERHAAFSCRWGGFIMAIRLKLHIVHYPHSQEEKVKSTNILQESNQRLCLFANSSIDVSTKTKTLSNVVLMI